MTESHFRTGECPFFGTKKGAESDIIKKKTTEKGKRKKEKENRRKKKKTEKGRAKSMSITEVLCIAILVLLVILIILVLTKKPKTDTAKLEEIGKVGQQSQGQLAMLNQSMAELKNQNNEQQTRLQKELNESNEKQNRIITDSILQMRESNEQKLDQMRRANTDSAEKQSEQLSKAISSMQESNEKKLEEMRNTVDEKLTATLNKRINASFEQVSTQLENVHKSLGEMKELSAGVTDNVKGLNRVLTNVKARGTWAEVQLGNILDETIPAGMYETNVKTNPKYNGQVEFAVKIPTEGGDKDGFIWLPIDSKFPMEDYARLAEASENGDLPALEAAKKALEARIKSEAKDIKNYIAYPETTPYAIMYLATEGLYAEVMQNTGLTDHLQKERITVAGPSTITAILNSFAMGFRTIAINKKADEVVKVLSAAKTQYNQFGELLIKAKQKVEDAGKFLDKADHRNRIIQKKLKGIEELEEAEAARVLSLDAAIEEEES